MSNIVDVITGNRVLKKIEADTMFLILPAISIIFSLTWRDFINEYFDQYMVKDEVLLKRKFYLAVIVTLIALLVLYFVRDQH